MTYQEFFATGKKRHAPRVATFGNGRTPAKQNVNLNSFSLTHLRDICRLPFCFFARARVRATRHARQLLWRRQRQKPTGAEGSVTRE